MSRKKKLDDEAARALSYGPKSFVAPTHDAMDNGSQEDDPDPNGTWDDDDWAAFDERN